MRSLFLRIFLSFWLAMGIILIAGILVASTVAWQRFNRLQDTEVADYAPVAEKALREQGTQGLKAWVLNSQRDFPGWRLYVVDSQGKDLLNRNLPKRWEHRVNRMIHQGDLQPASTYMCPSTDPLGMTPHITGPGGAAYTLFAAYTALPPFNVLGTLDINLLLLMIALAVSGMVSWWLGRYVSRPVAKLQASARSLAAGNLDARVGPESSQRRDELGVLARDFDRMADQLRALMASKETLLRDMSHELRSPLARLRVALGLARRDGADVARELDRIEREAERLDDLVGEILKLSQLTTAEPALQRRRMDISGLISDLVEDARLEASAEAKTVRWQPEISLAVEAEPELLRSGIENVLRNAVRFTEPATEVEVQLVREDRWAVLTVHDHGPGVPEGDLLRIFEPFYRVAEARERGTGGTGLGLAITARVTSLLGGQVRARNAGGGGLEIEIRLPIVE